MKPCRENVSPEVLLNLPPVVANLVRAADEMRKHYQTSHGDRLLFTFDGNLVGDIGEALAFEYYGMILSPRCGEGADGRAQGKTVQVKATGTGGRAMFRDTHSHADHLLFFSIDFSTCSASVIYNGLEAPVRAKLMRPWAGQKAISIAQMRVLDLRVSPQERLPLVQQA